MRLLAATNNAKGDLFGRLCADLLLTLGYESPRLNIHKTGREVDISATHRLEPKRAIAECKALSNAVGGDELNKFAGVLQAEKANEDLEVQGYFVSLSGFRESAIAQEEELPGQRFVLVDGPEVESQLVAGGMVINPRSAAEVAGRLAADLDGSIVSEPELLAHDLGWIWSFRLGTNREATHFALVHADGSSLSAPLARRVIDDDTAIGGDLSTLEYLLPDGTTSAKQIAEADAQYRQYLLAELGDITLEGLPADEEVGARRIALEDLYVPLKLENVREQSLEIDVDRPSTDSREGQAPDDDVEVSEAIELESIGAVLARHSRLAILAGPGAGKSTLIKRLAVAFADEVHRDAIDDNLPEKNQLPIFIRCRALGSTVRKSIREIIDDLPRRGEFPECDSGFRELVSSRLHAGEVLLLIDGLDEIASDSDRLTFVRQLRTFLAIYPQASVVVTSREVGFRVVGGAISSACEWYRLAEFDDQEIIDLTRGWHETVVGKRPEVDREAELLAHTIIETDRVRTLAQNPLLLTTLLLVKRWVGDLPRKRSLLYEKAIEVLLMTWNVEAHEPIDRDEAIPQLAFVAHSLSTNGIQRVSAKALTELLTKARNQMPEVLGYARISVSQFVAQVESRSSLMVMTGHEEEDGQLLPQYEFRHLTFQEYLTAVALIEGYYDGHKEGDRVVDRVEPRLGESTWFEIIALVNVLAGRSARPIVMKMLEVAEASDGSNEVNAGAEAWMEESALVSALLGRCLADEVQLPPEVVVRIAGVFGRSPLRSGRELVLVREIVHGRYGDAFTSVVESDISRRGDNAPEFVDVFSRVVEESYAPISMQNQKLVEWISGSLSGEDVKEAARASICAMQIAFGGGRAHMADWELVDKDSGRLMSWSADLVTWCEGDFPFMHCVATWALAWLGERGLVARSDRSRALRVLLRLWRGSGFEDTRRQAAWAFLTMPEVPRDSRPLGSSDHELRVFVEREGSVNEPDFARVDRAPAAIVLAYYLGAPWSDTEVGQMARQHMEKDPHPWGVMLSKIGQTLD